MVAWIPRFWILFLNVFGCRQRSPAAQSGFEWESMVYWTSFSRSSYHDDHRLHISLAMTMKKMMIIIAAPRGSSLAVAKNSNGSVSPRLRDFWFSLSNLDISRHLFVLPFYFGSREILLSNTSWFIFLFRSPWPAAPWQSFVGTRLKPSSPEARFLSFPRQFHFHYLSSWFIFEIFSCYIFFYV